MALPGEALMEMMPGEDEMGAMRIERKEFR